MTLRCFVRVTGHLHKVLSVSDSFFNLLFAYVRLVNVNHSLNAAV